MRDCFIGNIGIGLNSYKDFHTFFEGIFNMQKAIMQVQIPDIQNTIPEVFIIESLTDDDEKEKRYEGQILYDMLRLAGKDPQYAYIKKESQLQHIVGLFRESQYRFLHISSHANKTHIGMKFGNLTYDQFSSIFEGHLQLRKLFFSACEVGNESFINSMSKKNNSMHSIVAPTNKIQFDHAAAIWSALYTSLFAEKTDSMKGVDIEKRLRTLKGLFPVEFFFGTFDSVNMKWKNRII
jgi:hypothetical protein